MLETGPSIPENPRQAFVYYRSITDIQAEPLEDVTGLAEHMSRSGRSAHVLAAGDCYAEAALHSNTDLRIERRDELLERAGEQWRRAYEVERTASNDIAEKAGWAINQLPTFRAVARYMETGEIHTGINALQEITFRDYFEHILQRWPHEDLRGHALEALTSYFLHRANSFRDEPMYATPASVRDDYHRLADRRVDVNVYDIGGERKYGVQVKAGEAANPYSRQADRRIMYRRAGRMLTIDYGDRTVQRTIKAIVNDDQRYSEELDVIAADHRARLIRFFLLAEHVGVPIVRRAVTDDGEGPSDDTEA